MKLDDDRSHLYASRKAPPAWVERIHRWWHRKRYALLTPFYRDFYPFQNALSLQMQSVDHQTKWAKVAEDEAGKIRARLYELESTISQLRVALALAQLGWNEDRVDHFMGMWYQRHELPTAKEGERGD